MMPFISFMGPVLLTAMGSVSLVVCYQAILHLLMPDKTTHKGKKTRQTFQYVVPKLKEAALLSSVKVDQPSDWPRFSTGGCAVTSDGSCSTTAFEDARESSPDPMDSKQPFPSVGATGADTKEDPTVFCPLRV